MDENLNEMDGVDMLVLGAGEPVQGGGPSAAIPVLGKLTSLRWNMAASGVRAENVKLVAGFDIQALRAQAPDVQIYENVYWESSMSVGSYFCLPAGAVRPAVVIYSDIVVSHQLFEALKSSDSDVVVGWEDWRPVDESNGASRPKPYEKVAVGADGTIFGLGSNARTFEAAGFFMGAIFFSPRARAAIDSIPPARKKELAGFHMSELVDYLRLSGLSVSAVASEGLWAQVDDPSDLAKFILNSKADALSRLQPLVKKSRIPPSFSVTVGRWSLEPQVVLDEIFKKWSDTELVVRSSSLAEDSFDASQAGVFLSVIGVRGMQSVSDAVNQVIESYPGSDTEDQVLIQPKVQHLVANGVVVTRSLGSGAPWMSINFEESARSDGVTSGQSKHAQTIHLNRSSPKYLSSSFLEVNLSGGLPFWTHRVVDAVRELEEILHYSYLDIEFAIDGFGAVHVLQVRPLVLEKMDNWPSDLQFDGAVTKGKDSWRRHLSQTSTNPPLSNMTDWNPAEILGVAPGVLALTLYESLITNTVWAASRASFGYRDLRPRPLLVDISGRPYVDVMASLESFIPDGLENKNVNELLGFFRQRLEDNPALHDKVEFEVVPTCWTSDFRRWRQMLRKSGIFKEALIDHYENLLREITQSAIQEISGDFGLLRELETRIEDINGRPEISIHSKIQLKLDVCRRYGTFPFANLARRAFIAVTIIRDAVSSGLISEQAMGDFFESIRSVSHEIVADGFLVHQGQLEWESFVGRYGHLRPGTYDITSPRYDSEPEFFLRPLTWPRTTGEAKSSGSSWLVERRRLFEWFSNVAPGLEGPEIEGFLRDAIEGRESAKFSFTRILSGILEDIKGLAPTLGLGTAEIQHLRLADILEHCEESANGKPRREKINWLAQRGKASQEVASNLKLPAFISKESHFHVFLAGADVANFVGRGRVISGTVNLSGYTSDPSLVMDRIVMIDSADPGYDWIFGHKIAGLVTMYGGANSHMAIRAAEFGLSAAIGIGETLFESLLAVRVVELDPLNHIVRALR